MRIRLLELRTRLTSYYEFKFKVKKKPVVKKPEPITEIKKVEEVVPEKEEEEEEKEVVEKTKEVPKVEEVVEKAKEKPDQKEKAKKVVSTSSFKGVNVAEVDEKRKNDMLKKMKKKEKFKPVAMKIDNINANGVVDILFNQRMKVPEQFQKRYTKVTNSTRKLGKKESLNIDSLFEISVGDQTSQNRKKSKIDLIEWTPKLIKIQIDFDDPLAISQNKQDIANIKIKDTQYFVSEASGETISKEAVNNMNY